MGSNLYSIPTDFFFLLKRFRRSIRCSSGSCTEHVMLCGLLATNLFRSGPGLCLAVFHFPRQRWRVMRKASGWKRRGPVLREAVPLNMPLFCGHTRATGFHRDCPPIWQHERWALARAALPLTPHAHHLSMPLSTHVTGFTMAELT